MSSVEESSLAMNAQFVKALSIGSGLQEKVATNRSLNTAVAIKSRLSFFISGYCSDAFEADKPQGKLCEPRKTGRAYRRKMRKQKKEKLMRIMTYGYKSGIGYTDWGWKDGVYQPVGRYIQYPKNSNRQTFWKTYSNRKIRRYKGNIRKGNSYRRHFDYAWEVD